MFEEYEGPVLNVRDRGEQTALGTWWWDLDLLVRPDKKTGLTAEKAFDMLVKENVSEIYLEANPGEMPQWGSVPVSGKASLEQTAEFIGRCGAADIRVSALIGCGGRKVLQWFDEKRGYPEITSYVKGVAAFNAHVPAEQRFYGIHLDLEPDMGEEALKYRSQMRRFLIYTRNICDCCGLALEIDAVAWYNDDWLALDENGKEVLMADVLTECCDSVAVMAYRANAEDQLDLADYLIESAKRNNCRIIVGCETGSPESLGSEAFITYANHSAEVFADEQKKLRSALEEKKIPAGFGLAVHWVNTWYEMNMRSAVLQSAVNIGKG